MCVRDQGPRAGKFEISDYQPRPLPPDTHLAEEQIIVE